MGFRFRVVAKPSGLESKRLNIAPMLDIAGKGLDTLIEPSIL